MQRVKLVDTSADAADVTRSNTGPGNRDLVIFVLGWGADESVVSHIRPKGYDIWAVYDYRTIEPLPLKELALYEKIYLFAWSFGVWASDAVMGGVKPYRSIAFGGTPYPVDDRHGIPERAFAITLRSIGTNGPEEFNRRAYGEFYDKLAPSFDNRPWSERLEELKFLYGMSSKKSRHYIKWDSAVIGGRDMIFPPANLKAYWNSAGLNADIPHYPFGDKAIIEQFLDRIVLDKNNDNR